MYSTISNRSKLLGVFASLLIAFVMMFCLVGQAHADEFSNTVSTSSVQVRVGDSSTGTVQTVYFANCDPVASNIGALFQKNGVYNLVGASNYVSLQDILTQAGVADGDWTSVRFYTANPATGVAYGYYAKFNNGVFPYASTPTIQGMSEYLPFYGDTTGSLLGSTATYTYRPVIGYSVGATALSTTPASSALNTLTYGSSAAPRLLMGYDSGNVGGNRMPSQIIGIEVTE